MVHMISYGQFCAVLAVKSTIHYRAACDLFAICILTQLLQTQYIDSC